MVKVADRVHWFTKPKDTRGCLVGKHPACLTKQERVYCAATRESFGESILAGEACGICARVFLKLTVSVPTQQAFQQTKEEK